MVRRATLAILLVIGAAIIVAPGTADADARPPQHQAWAQTGPPSVGFVAANDRAYVGATAGSESLRAYLQLDDATVTAAATQQDAAVTLLNDSAASLLPNGVTIAACAAAGRVTSDGQLDAGSAPPTDCTTRIDISPGSDGTWKIPLSVFAQRWASSPPGTGAIALVANIDSPAATWRLAFDTAKTSLNVQDATVAPEPAPPPAEPSAPLAEAPLITPAPAPFIAVPSPLVPKVPNAPSLRREVLPTISAPAAGRGQGPHPAALPFLVALVVVAAITVVATPLRRRVVTPSLSGATEGVAGAALLTALAVLPLLASEVTVYRAGLVLIFIIAALGLQLLISWAGQLSLAHAGMVGLPAFVVLALSAEHDISPIYLLPVAIAIGALTGAVVALPTLRAKGLQVALVTLAAGIAIDRYFFTKRSLVGPAGGRTAAEPMLGPLTFTTSKSLYPFLLVIAALVFAVTWMLMHSRAGRAWFWIRGNGTAAAAFGIPVTIYRIVAFAVAGAYAGLAGGLTVVWVQRLTPDAFPTGLSFTYLLVAVLAGPGYVGGVVVAAVALEGGRLFSSGAGTLAAYLGPVALILTITRYSAGLNGGGRTVMEHLRRLAPIGDADRESRPITISTIAGWLAIAAGFTMIALAWYHTGNTNQTWIQNQELVSGGIGGLGLVILGTGLLIRERVAASHERLAHRLESLMAERADVARGNGSTTRRRRTAPVASEQ